jgi:hypothetical protein
LRMSVCEGLDHWGIVTCHVTQVNSQFSFA